MWSLPVDMWGDEETVYWVKAEYICFLTTKFDLGDYNVMVVALDGKKYYSKLRLGDFEDKLEENPWFMRTTRHLIVNFKNITRARNSSARDLWFEGVEEPEINAVSGSNLKEFKKRFEDL